MKISNTLHALLFAGMVTSSLAFTPVLLAQMSPAPDADQSSKTPDSTADQNNSSTSTATTPATAPDKTSSKATTNALDQNPSTAPTDSAEKSATKEPTGATDQAQSTARTSSTTNKQSEPISDKQFILSAAQGGMTEVELGKLAQQKAISADVKQFGSRMVTDHSQVNDQLKAVAQKEGVTVPQTLDAKHQATVDRMSHLSGPAFDKAYVHTMVRDHEKDAAEFRKESTNAQNPDVKAFAGNTLPVIDSHLSEIKSIQGKLQ